MKAAFVVCSRIGNGQTPDTAYRPWFADSVTEWSGQPIPGQFLCNVFALDQSTLDLVSSDPKTEFSFPIDVNGTELAYDDIFEIPPFTRGKIIAWCAKTYGAG